MCNTDTTCFKRQHNTNNDDVSDDTVDRLYKHLSALYTHALSLQPTAAQSDGQPFSLPPSYDDLDEQQQELWLEHVLDHVPASVQIDHLDQVSLSDAVLTDMIQGFTATTLQAQMSGETAEPSVLDVELNKATIKLLQPIYERYVYGELSESDHKSNAFAVQLADMTDYEQRMLIRLLCDTYDVDDTKLDADTINNIQADADRLSDTMLVYKESLTLHQQRVNQPFDNNQAGRKKQSRHMQPNGDDSSVMADKQIQTIKEQIHISHDIEAQLRRLTDHQRQQYLSNYIRLCSVEDYVKYVNQPDQLRHVLKQQAKQDKIATLYLNDRAKHEYYNDITRFGTSLSSVDMTELGDVNDYMLQQPDEYVLNEAAEPQKYTEAYKLSAIDQLCKQDYQMLLQQLPASMLNDLPTTYDGVSDDLKIELFDQIDKLLDTPSSIMPSNQLRTVAPIDALANVVATISIVDEKTDGAAADDTTPQDVKLALVSTTLQNSYNQILDSMNITQKIDMPPSDKAFNDAYKLSLYDRAVYVYQDYGQRSVNLQDGDALSDLSGNDLIAQYIAADMFEHSLHQYAGENQLEDAQLFDVYAHMKYAQYVASEADQSAPQSFDKLSSEERDEWRAIVRESSSPNELMAVLPEDQCDAIIKKRNTSDNLQSQYNVNTLPGNTAVLAEIEYAMDNKMIAARFNTLGALTDKEQPLHDTFDPAVEYEQLIEKKIGTAEDQIFVEELEGDEDDLYQYEHMNELQVEQLDEELTAEYNEPYERLKEAEHAKNMLDVIAASQYVGKQENGDEVYRYTDAATGKQQTLTLSPSDYRELLELTSGEGTVDEQLDDLELEERDREEEFREDTSYDDYFKDNKSEPKGHREEFDDVQQVKSYNPYRIPVPQSYYMAYPDLPLPPGPRDGVTPWPRVPLLQDWPHPIAPKHGNTAVAGTEKLDALPYDEDDIADGGEINQHELGEAQAEDSELAGENLKATADAGAVQEDGAAETEDADDVAEVDENIKLTNPAFVHLPATQKLLHMERLQATRRFLKMERIRLHREYQRAPRDLLQYKTQFVVPGEESDAASRYKFPNPSLTTWLRQCYDDAVDLVNGQNTWKASKKEEFVFKTQYVMRTIYKQWQQKQQFKQTLAKKNQAKAAKATSSR